jgi:hypothetical protein
MEGRNDMIGLLLATVLFQEPDDHLVIANWGFQRGVLVAGDHAFAAEGVIISFRRSDEISRTLIHVRKLVGPGDSAIDFLRGLRKHPSRPALAFAPLPIFQPLAGFESLSEPNERQLWPDYSYSPQWMKISPVLVGPAESYEVERLPNGDAVIRDVQMASLLIGKFGAAPPSFKSWHSVRRLLDAIRVQENH